MRLLCPTACALVLVAIAAQARLSPEQISQLPAPATNRIEFARDIKPILDSACVKCHGKGKEKGNFSLETRDSFFKGGDSGAPVVQGKSAESLLIELVSGLNPDNVMPQKGTKLKPAQISLLRAWVDQGAAWPAEFTFKKAPIANLQARRVALPQGSEINPVDRLLASYLADHKMTSAAIEDRVFARRVYLDVIGALPSPEEMSGFLADKQPDRREKLVEKLLQDRRRYAEHWLTFWNDLLRNDYRGTGFIDGGRKQISTWLFSALLTNMPYDRFVAQLVSPIPESEGFVNGIVWRGAVNASQVPVMQAAQNIGQVFMGVNLKCASCHDSFINDYTLADSYGIAAIYATNKLEIAECDKPTGKNAKVKFLYSELGEIDGSLPRAERARQLADLLTSRHDGRLTRTIVNRLWAVFMGRGLVEPVDEMDSPAWHADLLDWLAEDLADHGYDLKRTMQVILTSRAYQMPSVNVADPTDKQYVFRGPAIRRLTAEQFRDALGSITGIWYTKPATTFNLTGTSASPDSGNAGFSRPEWIWSTAGSDKKAPAETLHFRKSFTLAAIPASAYAAIACDNSFTLWVNGHKAASGDNYGQPAFADLKPHLVTGTNIIAITAINNTPDNKAPKADQPPREEDANPAGLLFAAQFGGKEKTRLRSDQSWVWTRKSAEGWRTAAFDDSSWTPAAELGGASAAPWNIGDKFDSTLALADLHGRVRSSLVAADPLMLALGRPNREQVMTARQAAATTLQALELTNGDTLDALLKDGAKRLAEGSASSEQLIQSVFIKALGRSPSDREQKLAAELIGSPAGRENVEDFLWSVAMLPEFQLIY